MKVEKILEYQNLDREMFNIEKQLKDKLNQNIQILEKNLASLAERMNATLAEFNKAVKTINSSKEDYAKYKQAYDEDVKQIDREKAQVAYKLKAISADIDTKIMEAYLKRRKENVFPVVVPLKGNSCGGCHMELPYANLTKLNEAGVLSCEHCRRIIYKG